MIRDWAVHESGGYDAGCEESEHEARLALMVRACRRHVGQDLLMLIDGQNEFTVTSTPFVECYPSMS
jgi:hypothetical protein